MPHLIRIDADKASPMEAQALLLALLAWPDELPDGPNLAKAQVAFCGHLLRTAATVDPEWALQPRWIKPVYLLQDHDEVRATVASSLNRLRRTLLAVRAARPFVMRAGTGQKPNLPPAVARLSLNETIAYVLEAEGQPDRDPHVFERDVFRPAKCVLHLGLALEAALAERHCTTGGRPSLELLMLDETACKEILAQAEVLEPILLQVTRFKVDPDLQVHLRVAMGTSAPPIAGT